MVVTDQNPENSPRTQEYSWTLSHIQSQFSSIPCQNYKFTIESDSQYQTEAKFAQLWRKFEQFSEIHVNHHHWIAEPAIQREHATGVARCKRNHRLWIREEEGRSGEGFHRIRIKGEEEKIETSLPVKIKTKNQRNGSNLRSKNPGKTLIPSHLFLQYHRNPEWCDSKAVPNRSIQYTNPNTKIISKIRGTLRNSQRVWIEAVSHVSITVSIKRTEKTNGSNTLRWKSQINIIQTVKFVFLCRIHA